MGSHLSNQAPGSKVKAHDRLAQTNDIGLTAMEDGHTVEMLKRNYLNPRFSEDAELWFSLTPDKVRVMCEEKVIEIAQ